jgi:hypothetical protein
MRLYRCALIAFATVLVATAAARPAAAASYQLCLALDGDSSQYFLNFMVQGNAILVAGDKGHGGQDDHGPVFGALSHTPETPQIMEMGLTVTFANGGDYSNQNTENVVFTFTPDGAIAYKRWLNSAKEFTQGTASVIVCH